jgi:hypothetical protein
MKPDPHLRAIVASMRRFNVTHSDDDWKRAEALMGEYVWPTAALDTDAAIRVLLDFDSDVSPELRYALARFLAGRIKAKRGRKPTLTLAQLAAHNAQEHAAAGIPAKEAIARAAREFKALGVTVHAIDAVLWPRKRQRKTT